MSLWAGANIREGDKLCRLDHAALSSALPRVRSSWHTSERGRLAERPKEGLLAWSNCSVQPPPDGACSWHFPLTKTNEADAVAAAVRNSGGPVAVARPSLVVEA
jgi:hypothetical protein